MVIDVHAHHYPRRYLDLIQRTELPPPSAVLGALSIDQRLGLLDQVGIDTQVLSVSQAQPYLPGAAQSAEAARVANDLYVEVCQEHPGRFYAFAALPLPHTEVSLAEIDRTAGQSPFVGFTLGCSIAGRELDDPVLEPVYAELDRRAATVFLHPVGREDTPWLAAHNLAWLVGAPFEDTVAALRLILGGVVARHPRIRFIVPHLGGTLPFLQARLSRLGEERIADGLRGMYYDTVSGSPDALTCACHAVTAEHLLFGTDYPYCNEAELRHHLSFLDEGGLDAAELAAIRGGTAASLLGLSGGTAGG